MKGLKLNGGHVGCAGAQQAEHGGWRATRRAVSVFTQAGPDSRPLPALLPPSVRPPHTTSPGFQASGRTNLERNVKGMEGQALTADRRFFLLCHKL